MWLIHRQHGFLRLSSPTTFISSPELPTRNPYLHPPICNPINVYRPLRLHLSILMDLECTPSIKATSRHSFGFPPILPLHQHTLWGAPLRLPTLPPATWVGHICSKTESSSLLSCASSSQRCGIAACIDIVLQCIEPEATARISFVQH